MLDVDVQNQLVHKRSERDHLYQGAQTDAEQGWGEIQSCTDLGTVDQVTDHVTLSHNNHITVNKASARAESPVKN